MQTNEVIKQLEEQKQRVVNITRSAFWSVVIIACLCAAEVLPAMLFFIAYPIGLIVWGFNIGKHDEIDYAIYSLNKSKYNRVQNGSR